MGTHGHRTWAEKIAFSHSLATHTRKEWRKLKERYGNRCLACGQVLELLTRDHIVPVSQGGSSHISNIQPLCRPCNSLKGDEIIDFRKKYQKRPVKGEPWQKGDEVIEL